MKKIMSVLCAIVMLVSCVLLQGCGSDITTNNTDVNNDSGNVNNIPEDTDNDGGAEIIEEALKATDLSIESFAWETVQSKYNGVDCYSFSLKNNSDYDVIAVEFTYKVRDDVADSDLAVYSEFMKDHEGYIEENDSPRDVVLRGSKNEFIAKGEELTNLRFAVGYKNWVWYDYPTNEQFKIMEPQEMQIGIVGKNNVLYIAYYDFENNSWMLDEKTQNVDTWSEKEIAQKISKPAENHHIVTEDEEDEFKFVSYGITADEYAQYVEEIKKAGFEEENSSSLRFEGTNEDGYEVEMWYYVEESRLSVGIEKKA